MLEDDENAEVLVSREAMFGMRLHEDGAALSNGKYNPCTLTNNVVGSQTRNGNFGVSSSLVGDAGREFQYSLKFSF